MKVLWTEASAPCIQTNASMLAVVCPLRSARALTAADSSSTEVSGAYPLSVEHAYHDEFPVETCWRHGACAAAYHVHPTGAPPPAEEQ